MRIRPAKSGAGVADSWGREMADRFSGTAHVAAAQAGTQSADEDGPGPVTIVRAGGGISPVVRWGCPYPRTGGQQE